MIILGLAPGLAIVGWGVLESARRGFRVLGYGSVTTPANTPTEERLATIYSDMNELFMRFRPDAVSVEELFFSKNITTGIRVAEARGVLLLSAQQHCVPVFEYSPPQVKQAVVGYGNAEKRQVISMVTSLLSLKAPPKPDDTADALALAICHANSAASPLARLGQ